MQATPTTPPSPTPLQLLLFIDKRPSSREHVRRVRNALKDLRTECDFELQIIEVSEQPYLAEYFRIIATPALIKIHPEPRHSLAGTNLVEQLKHWWPHWYRSVVEYQTKFEAQSKQAATPEAVLELANSAIAPPAPITASLTEPLELLPRPDSASPELADAQSFAAEIAETASNVMRLTSATTDAMTANIEPPAPPTPALPPADEEAKPAVVRLSPVHSAGSTPRSRSGLTSISQSAELLRLSDEIFKLQREKEELQHQLQFKDQIIAMLAHDLRNPLTATSLALETLDMGYNPKEGATTRLTAPLAMQLIKHARTQTRAIDQMVTDILQAAKGSGSELQIQPQKLELGLLCLEVLDHLKQRFVAKALHINKDLPSDLPNVLADGERVRQVLINLLDNAVKYTPIGGTIQLSALHRTTQKVQVSVCDSGPGIPPENKNHIFEERFRLQRDADTDGYGLGLSLCQRIIRAHYGQIWVDSTPNQGSCFHFTLPVLRG
jgi:two-component system, OmpR family, clock-associated histidine kinase SasA